MNQPERVLYEYGLRLIGEIEPFVSTFDYTKDGAFESLTWGYDERRTVPHQLVRREKSDQGWEVVPSVLDRVSEKVEVKVGRPNEDTESRRRRNFATIRACWWSRGA